MIDDEHERSEEDGANRGGGGRLILSRPALFAMKVRLCPSTRSLGTMEDLIWSGA